MLIFRTVDQFRKAFQNLGEKMTDEGYLSESGRDLLCKNVLTLFDGD